MLYISVLKLYLYDVLTRPSAGLHDRGKSLGTKQCCSLNFCCASLSSVYAVTKRNTSIFVYVVYQSIFLVEECPNEKVDASVGLMQGA